MNIEIEVRTLPTTQQPLGTLLTTIDMPDLVEESFRMHISLCDDEYFHFGGCVAAWIKFTTTKLTYGNNTPIRWDRVGMFVRTYTVDENDNRTYTLLGTFYGKEYTETVNHTRVDVTAYDPMYLIATCDLTKWYNEFVPSAQENFILQFMTRAYDEVLSKTPVYAETVGGIDVDESEAFTEAFGNIQWKRTVVIDGREEPLMSGTITYGKLLKDFCIACGYNATLDVKPTGYAVLHYRNVTAAKTPIAIAPTEYRDLEYSSFDTDAFTNVRIKAYNSMFDATNTETLTYGILNNWITNVGTQYSRADQTQAETLLTMLQRMIYRPCSFTTFERKCNIGDYVDITDTNGNVYHAIVMQEDISGIVGASFTYTCLATGDYYKETGTVDYYDDNLFSIDDTYPTVTEAATRTNLSIGDTMKTIIGKIKKFFADLKTVAFTGSYNDLTDKPTIPVGSDYIKKSATIQTIENTSTNQYATLWLKSNSSAKKAVVGFTDTDETRLGYLGVSADKKPIFLSGASGSTDKEIALAENVIKTSNAGTQSITTTDGVEALAVRSASGGSRSYVGYQANNGTEWGRIGVNSSGVPIFTSDGGTTDLRMFKQGDTAILHLAGGIAITATAEAHADLNTFTTTGTYYLSSNTAGNVDNRPVTNSYRFTLIVQRIGNNSSCIRQIYMTYSNAVFYVRATSNGGSTWTDWTYMALGTHLDSYVKLSDSTIRTITNTGAGRTVLVAKSGVTTGALVGFQDKNGTELGWLGANSSKKPVFWDSAEHELALKSDIPSTTDFLATAGGQMTGAITFAQGSIAQQTANTMPYFLGIDAFASGGAMKWQSAAGVVNALNSGASGLVKKTTNIQSGYAQLSSGNNTINFGTAFGGAPNVIVGLAGIYNGYARVTSKTASAFVVAASTTLDIYWIAYYG